MTGSDDDFFDSPVNGSSPSNTKQPKRSTSAIDDFKTERTNKDEDTIRIIVATDIHCGYGERKGEIGQDAVNTFEEILQIALEQKADMVLLGGDLFHENLPSREVQLRVIQLLRKYCMNNNPVQLEFMSDPTMNFKQSRFDFVNYYDENLNIGLPVFTIHGNHDDLSGKGLTALEPLHESGLINLFGKHSDISKFDVTPILLRKGETRLALYGIGSQQDDRLARAFQTEDIKFLRPQSGPEDWFNLLTLHQNRPPRATHRTTGRYLPEKLIPTFFDLVIWGHEHESKPNPEYSASSEIRGDGFYVLQPGSTVATSLTTEEGLQKHAFLIKVKHRTFKCKPIPLQTTRQLIVNDLILDTMPPNCRRSENGRPITTKREYYDELKIKEKIKEMIDFAEKTRRPRQPKLPLLRLNVWYKDEWASIPPANGKRLGGAFESLVANPTEIIMIKKDKRKANNHNISEPVSFDTDQLGSISARNLQNIINEFFESSPLEKKMTVIKANDIGKALENYADSANSQSKANQQFEHELQRPFEFIKKKMMEIPPDLSFKNGVVNINDYQEQLKNDLKILKSEYYRRITANNGEIDEEMDTNYGSSVPRADDVDENEISILEEGIGNTQVKKTISTAKSTRGRRGRPPKTIL